ncbi:hypothetical protein Cgig2_024734 [Carnegiea gigantea]|uniref:BZIP domain-containing protein n=1 Tax=Carnegiea gigantea TaxID=171969 RepID=A0A9Q1Q5R5_9CARY|nr:hypothetical protein Cgig2_024734 [Carnegiea gigantea]
MLSTLCSVPAADTLLGNPFSALHGDFTPWENLESYFITPSNSSEGGDGEPNFGPEITCYQAGSYDPNQKSPLSNSDSNQNSPISNLFSSSGSEDPNQNSVNLKFGSCYSDHNESNQKAVVMDEQKQKRMRSNRESARRSRMRKQRHIENLRNQLNRLKMENQELLNCLRLVNHRNHLLRGDNDRFRTESIILQGRLLEICRILRLQQLQRQNYSSSCMPMQ